jgi:hypothetical protein
MMTDDRHDMRNTRVFVDAMPTDKEMSEMVKRIALMIDGQCVDGIPCNSELARAILTAMRELTADMAERSARNGYEHRQARMKAAGAVMGRECPWGDLPAYLKDEMRSDALRCWQDMIDAALGADGR